MRTCGELKRKGRDLPLLLDFSPRTTGVPWRPVAMREGGTVSLPAPWQFLLSQDWVPLCILAAEG